MLYKTGERDFIDQKPESIDLCWQFVFIFLLYFISIAITKPKAHESLSHTNYLHADTDEGK